VRATATTLTLAIHGLRIHHLEESWGSSEIVEVDLPLFESEEKLLECLARIDESSLSTVLICTTFSTHAAKRTL
jgi:hypothetical protein